MGQIVYDVYHNETNHTTQMFAKLIIIQHLCFGMIFD